jgi:hypothetical protein
VAWAFYPECATAACVCFFILLEAASLRGGIFSPLAKNSRL